MGWLSTTEIDPEWQHQELLERQQWELEAGLLRADPAYGEWLDKLQQEHTYDKRERHELR